MKSNDVESGTNELSFLFPVFLMNHLPQAHKTTLESFQIFAKFSDIFASQGAPPLTNLPPVSTGVNYIGDKLPQVCINDTNSKFATGVNASDKYKEQYQIAYTLK
jgi:hypothetical protein